MMMALMENAAMLAVKNELPDGCTTVVDREKFLRPDGSKRPEVERMSRL
jgi:hypothetical protein